MTDPHQKAGRWARIGRFARRPCRQYANARSSLGLRPAVAPRFVACARSICRVIKRLQVGDEAEARALLSRFKGGAEIEVGEFLADSSVLLLVAKEQAELAGWLYAYELRRPEGRPAMLLYELEVAAEARGRGHGRALVEALLDQARSRGHLKMWVLTDPDNDAAQALYKSAGGEPIPQLMFTWNLR